MSADPGDATDEENKVRWPLVILAVVVGLLVLAGGWFIAYGGTAFQGEHAAFWSGLFVNVGTTVLLATALVWFERTIVRRVKRQTAITVAGAVNQAATDAATRATAAVSTRLDDLEKSFQERAGSGATSRLATAELVSEVPTFEAIYDALSTARRIQAIGQPRFERPRPSGGEVVVPAGDTLDAPSIAFSVLDGHELIFIGHVVGLARTSEMIWDEHDDPLDVLTGLTEKMLAEGHGAALKHFSVEKLFSNLSRVLRDATIAREHRDERWLSGDSVREMITNDCFLSDAGVEVRGHGVVSQRTEFGRIRDNRTLEDFSVRTEPPAGTPSDVWERAVQRGKDQFTSRSRGVPLPPYSSYWGT